MFNYRNGIIWVSCLACGPAASAIEVLEFVNPTFGTVTLVCTFRGEVPVLTIGLDFAQPQAGPAKCE